MVRSRAPAARPGGKVRAAPEGMGRHPSRAGAALMSRPDLPLLLQRQTAIRALLPPSTRIPVAPETHS